MTNVLLPTTDLVMDRIEKKKMVKDFVNVGPCDITEKLVLTVPYYNYLGRNVFDDKILPFVKQNLYKNSSLKVEVGKLRNNFMNNAQAFCMVIYIVARFLSINQIFACLIVSLHFTDQWDMTSEM